MVYESMKDMYISMNLAGSLVPLVTERNVRYMCHEQSHSLSAWVNPTIPFSAAQASDNLILYKLW